jgi:hypothetical protein
MFLYHIRRTAEDAMLTRHLQNTSQKRYSLIELGSMLCRKYVIWGKCYAYPTIKHNDLVQISDTYVLNT